jgi:hypothetical protein
VRKRVAALRAVAALRRGVLVFWCLTPLRSVQAKSLRLDIKLANARAAFGVSVAALEGLKVVKSQVLKSYLASLVRWFMKSWDIDFGLWTLDFGLWTLDFGLWTFRLSDFQTCVLKSSVLTAYVVRL